MSAGVRDGVPIIGRVTGFMTSGSSVSDRSSAGAEWVSAPTETKCTPVLAAARIVSSVIPPLASSVARPPTCSTARRNSSAVMLSSSSRVAPAASAASISAVVRHSTSSGTPG